MTQPKAKWEPCDGDPVGDWEATVGPFYMLVCRDTGRCELAEWFACDDSVGATLWLQHAPTPCDAQELMALTEAELSRRLTAAALSMDGSELGRKPEPAQTVSVYSCEARFDSAQLREQIANLPPRSTNVADAYLSATNRLIRDQMCKLCGEYPRLERNALTNVFYVIPPNCSCG